jgi:hypothetical protein
MPLLTRLFHFQKLKHLPKLKEAADVECSPQGGAGCADSFAAQHHQYQFETITPSYPAPSNALEIQIR